MRKRGLSNVIQVLIVVLLSISAIGLLWSPMQELLRTSEDSISISDFSANTVIKSVKINPPTNLMKVLIRKNPGIEKINITSIRFIVEDKSKSESFTIPIPGGLPEIAERTFFLDLNESGLDINNLQKISIVPIYVNKKGGNQMSTLPPPDYNLKNEIGITLKGSWLIPSASNYSDVLLVTNTNSPDSIEVSNYYIQTRGITHQLNISVTTDEVIPFATFSSEIRQPIETYLTENDLVNSINYIVLAKELPLRVDNSGGCKSVDSMLTLILSANSNKIENGLGCDPISEGYFGFQNPMYNKETHASKTYYDIYIVARLEGYTVQDVKNAMGSSTIYQNTGSFLLDQQISNPQGYWQYFDRLLGNANDFFITRGILSIFDESPTFRTNLGDLSGYYSFGSNDWDANPDSSKWNLEFNPGSIGDTAVSTSGRSFSPGTPYGQSLIADLIAGKISFVKGYVYEPYSSAISHPEIVLNRYASDYDAGESMYMGSPKINWMDIYVGDPKLKMYQ